MAFVFNTGAVKMPLQNENGVEIGVATYNPKDFGILTRAKNSEHYLDKLVKIFEGYTKHDQTDEAALKVMERACNTLEEYCDTVFGKGFYVGAFEKINPFTELENGNWFAVEVINAVLGDIRDRVKAKAVLEEKYLKGYKNA